jgi:hypothetical protein
MYKVKKFLVIISLIFFLNPNYVLSDTKNDVEKECKELGFKENTPEIAQCKLEMMILSKKMNLENKKLEAAQAQAKASEEAARAAELNAAASRSIANSESWRNSRSLIQQGQSMMSGRCTLGVNC